MPDVFFASIILLAMRISNMRTDFYSDTWFGFYFKNKKCLIFPMYICPLPDVLSIA